MTDWLRVSVKIESTMEQLQSAWHDLGTASFEERYEKQWPIGTAQYHLQAAEKYVQEIWQELSPILSEWDVPSSERNPPSDGP